MMMDLLSLEGYSLKRHDLTCWSIKGFDEEPQHQTALQHLLALLFSQGVKIEFFFERPLQNVSALDFNAQCTELTVKRHDSFCFYAFTDVIDNAQQLAVISSAAFYFFQHYCVQVTLLPQELRCLPKSLAESKENGLVKLIDGLAHKTTLELYKVVEDDVLWGRFQKTPQVILDEFLASLFGITKNCSAKINTPQYLGEFIGGDNLDPDLIIFFTNRY